MALVGGGFFFTEVPDRSVSLETPEGEMNSCRKLLDVEGQWD